MADTTIFSRLQRLFSTNTIVRKTTTGTKVIDTDEYQNMTTNLVDRFMKLKVTNFASGQIDSSLAYQQVRIDLFRDYDSMDQDPILSSALDIYADECTAQNEMGNVLKIHHPDDNIKQILENLFYDILNVEFNLWPWTRNLVKYGDFFLQLEIAKDLGIVNVFPYSPYEITRVENFDPANPQRVKFVYAPYQNPLGAYGQTTKKEFENYEIAHFRLNSDSNFLPYGKSMIEGGRRVWKQLQLMEDAMLLHRVMRAPEKRIFKIDVGNIPPNEVDNYMQRIINNSKKVPFVDERTGEYNLKFNVQNMIEDYYMPVRGSDSGTSIDTLKGLEYNMIEDINYLKNKLMASLKIPKAYLNYEEDTGGKATLAALDSRFAKTVERIQRVLVSELTKIAIIHLYTQGIDDAKLTDFTIELTTPSKIYEQEKIELYTSKVQLIQSMQQTKMFSKEWMYEAIMSMAKDEQDEQTLAILEDTKQAYRLQSIETQGVDPAQQPEEPTNVEEEIQRIKEELEEEGKVGRPKDPVRYGKDDHPMGRDPLGIKTLKRKEGYSTYNKHKKSYQEIFKDMDGNKKKIVNG
ncbi:portal vertex protein [uncultured Caudovirales phage]|uniref:Portal vertex protein n=1 Tax=uncultured Caudovirales phage TaxID=2100421 RepID=A0A6J5M8B8_9CAUD|nr:portal vertex protein [uncultured Caudovirales phage]